MRTLNEQHSRSQASKMINQYATADDDVILDKILCEDLF